MTLFRLRNKQVLLEEQQEEKERYEAFIKENDKKKYDCSLCKNNRSVICDVKCCNITSADTCKKFYLSTGKMIVPIKWDTCNAFRMVNKCIACEWLIRKTMIIRDEKRTVYKCNKSDSDKDMIDDITHTVNCSHITHISKEELIERYKEYNQKGESNE